MRFCSVKTIIKFIKILKCILGKANPYTHRCGGFQEIMNLWLKEFKTSHSYDPKVRWGLLDNKIYKVYLNILNTSFQDLLKDIPLDRLPHFQFQHHGALPHSERVIHEFPNRKFTGKWIKNRYTVDLRICQLVPLICLPLISSYRMLLKDKVYKRSKILTI